MGLLDKLPGKKRDDDDRTPKTGEPDTSGTGELIGDPAYTGEYLPKEGAGGSPQGDAEEGDSGGSIDAAR